MVEEHEEEIWVGEEEVWVGQASQLPPFLVGSPATFEGYVGVSSEYPCLQARLVIERID